MTVRITALVKGGRRRAGLRHPAQAVDHPDDSFSADQLAALEADPLIKVERIADQPADTDPPGPSGTGAGSNPASSGPAPDGEGAGTGEAGNDPGQDTPQPQPAPPLTPAPGVAEAAAPADAAPVGAGGPVGDPSTTESAAPEPAQPKTNKPRGKKGSDGKGA